VDLGSALESDKIILSESTGGAAPPKAKRKRKKKAVTAKDGSNVDTSYDYALQSNRFLEDVLGKDTAKLIGSVGIFTAAELFEAEISVDSDLFRVMKEAGKLVLDNLESFSEIVDGWRHSLRRNLDRLRNKSSNGDASGINDPRSKTQTQNAKALPNEAFRMESHSKVADPINALSFATLRFLDSVGITTASHFLSSRSTDVAEHFVRWRVAEGKPELKGLGSIASVSSWKATVRKRAKEMGLEELSELEPPDGNPKSTRKPRRAPTRKKAVKAEVQVDDFLAKEKVHVPDILESQGSLSEGGRKLIALQGRGKLFVHCWSSKGQTS